MTKCTPADPTVDARQYAVFRAIDAATDENDSSVIDTSAFFAALAAEGFDVVARRSPCPTPEQWAERERAHDAECFALGSEIAAQRAESADQDAEIAVLRKALEPFAETAASYDPPNEDDAIVAWAHDFTIGSLRRARAALGKDAS